MIKAIFRYRTVFLFGGAIIATCLSLLTDPDKNGLSTLLGGLGLIQGVWAVALAHWSRKAIADYKEADQQSLFKKVSTPSVPAWLWLPLPSHSLAFSWSSRRERTQRPYRTALANTDTS